MVRALCTPRSGLSWASSAVDLTLRNTRRYGGYIVHMGMVLIFVGLAGAAFNTDVQKEMKLGSTLQIGRYNLLLQSFESHPEKNYTAERMIIEVAENNKPKMMLYPERRFSRRTKSRERWSRFTQRSATTCMLCTAGQSPDAQTPVIHAYLNPLVKWIWLGGAIVVMGTFVALLPNRRTVLALAGRRSLQS